MGVFKRSLFGYNRSQVDAAMDACAEKHAASERELLVLSEMLMAREREAETLRVQLADAHARHDRSLRSLEVLAGHLDELNAQARGQATRIRMKALNEAALVTERASEALEAVRRLQDAREGKAQNGQAAAAANGSANGAAAAVTNGPQAPGTVPPMPESDVERAGVEAVATSGLAQAGGTPGEIGYYQGDVEVEIGPLGDFSQLLGFESAAGGIEGATDISVRRFAAGRATLGLRLDEPIELLRELEERAPFEFKVRQTGGRRVVLDIDEQPTGDNL